MAAHFKGLSLSAFLSAVKKNMASNNNNFYKALMSADYSSYLSSLNNASEESEDPNIKELLQPLAELLADYYDQTVYDSAGYMAGGNVQRRYLDILSTLNTLSEIDPSIILLAEANNNATDEIQNIKVWMRPIKAQSEIDLQKELAKKGEDYFNRVSSVANNIHLDPNTNPGLSDINVDYNKVSRMISKDIRRERDIKTDLAKNYVNSETYNRNDLTETRIPSTRFYVTNDNRSNLSVFDIPFLANKLADRYIGNYQPDDYTSVLETMDNPKEYKRLLDLSDGIKNIDETINTLIINKYNIDDFLKFQSGEISEFQGLTSPIQLSDFYILFK